MFHDLLISPRPRLIPVHVRPYTDNLALTYSADPTPWFHDSLPISRTGQTPCIWSSYSISGPLPRKLTAHDLSSRRTSCTWAAMLPAAHSVFETWRACCVRMTPKGALLTDGVLLLRGPGGWEANLRSRVCCVSYHECIAETTTDTRCYIDRDSRGHMTRQFASRIDGLHSILLSQSTSIGATASVICDTRATLTCTERHMSSSTLRHI